MNSNRMYCLQHVPWEGPGMIEPYLRSRGGSLKTIRLFENQTLPDAELVDFLIVLGGPMNVDDEDIYAWLAREKSLIKQMIDAGKPVLGICLGAQLIAHVLSKPVYPAKEHEIGWYPVTLSSSAMQHPLTIGWDETPMVFHWHSNTFDMPEGAISLASSSVCVNQAFVLNDTIIGLQFHLEMSRENVQEMIRHWNDERESGPYVQTPEAMLAGSEASGKTQKMLYQLMDHWIEGFHGARHL